MTIFHRLTAIFLALSFCTIARADPPMSTSALFSILEIESQQGCENLRSRSIKTPTPRSAVETGCCFPGELASARKKLSKTQASSIVTNVRERSQKIMADAAERCRLVGAEIIKKEQIELCSLSSGAMNSSDPEAYCKCFSSELSKLSNSTIADISEKMEAYLSKPTLSESDKVEIEKLYSPLKTSCQ